MLLTVTHACPLNHSAREVWRVAGAYGSLHYIHSGTESTALEEGGRVRVLLTSSGAMLWERLLAFDDGQMTLRYRITDTKALQNCPYGSGYVGEVRIEAAGPEASVFHYKGIFEPLPGYGEEQARAAVRAFAQDCAQGMARYLQNQPGA